MPGDGGMRLVVRRDDPPADARRRDLRATAA